MSHEKPTGPDTRIPASIRAFLFDLDGVLTPTAVSHMHAWSRLFTPFLAEHDAAPYTDADYFAHIDGKPRYEGVRDLLASRGIELPLGDVTDEPGDDTVCALGNRKNAVFTATIAEEGVAPYPRSLTLVQAAADEGYAMAVVSSSKNAPEVLRAAGLERFFDIVVDGNVAAAHGIAGKPSPDTYTYGAELLGIPSQQCVVVEDAESGIRAGAAGDFGLVLGVDRGVGRATLEREGADLVVDELDEIIPDLHDIRASTRANITAGTRASASTSTQNTRKDRP